MPRANTAPIQMQINIPPGVATNLVVAVVVFGMAGTAAVVGTALYGQPENSERAFRLLHLLRRTPEPETPKPSPSPQSRTRPSARGKGVQAATLRP
ncbi:hypothetical protein P1P75_11830 [Streptomyces sp. ID05-39B]|uniref:hypothetical protein n=1 Tax=Streptomyces sp. ID05-39B TaxID=3028664 RepID=UPI0029A81D9A|nr:hypothetical protein [Streptomyces sp. ID05-39B]MDX3527113.1 hypothetical protein [Streptomyces sp. ID05-39B]